MIRAKAGRNNWSRPRDRGSQAWRRLLAGGPVAYGGFLASQNPGSGWSRFQNVQTIFTLESFRSVAQTIDYDKQRTTSRSYQPEQPKHVY